MPRFSYQRTDWRWRILHVSCHANPTERLGTKSLSVYRAANPKLDMVAACKVVPLTPETTKHERKELNKEIQVHMSLKHVNILDFINAFIVESHENSPWIPGVYMLLEIAAGGDLFDKIGELHLTPSAAPAYRSRLR